MLTKESKIRVLEDFYSLDYVFFGKPLKKVDSCSCSLLKEEYLSVKGALMSVMIEVLKLVNHTPESLTEKIDTKFIMMKARENARAARLNSKRIVISPKSRDSIKAELTEMVKSNEKIDVTEAVETKIREKAFCLAADNLLIAKMISESKDYKFLNDWSGRILEDSYKVLRDSLVECASNILDAPRESAE